MDKKRKPFMSKKECADKAEECAKQKADLKELIVGEALALADGTQPDVQMLLAYARQLQKRLDAEKAPAKEPPKGKK